MRNLEQAPAGGRDKLFHKLGWMKLEMLDRHEA
jgi:hypothetical protein